MATRAFTNAELAAVPELPFVLPAYRLGDSPPFSSSSHVWYSEQDLRAIRPKAETGRDDWFKKAIYGLYLTRSAPVPYAFRDAGGQVRSLDAGCLARLLKREPPYLRPIIRDGLVVAVEPTEAMLSAVELVTIQDRLLRWWSSPPSDPPTATLPGSDAGAPAPARQGVGVSFVPASDQRQAPRVYLTKTWGFHEPVPPLQFGAKGWRDAARDMLSRCRRRDTGRADLT